MLSLMPETDKLEFGASSERVIPNQSSVEVGEQVYNIMLQDLGPEYAPAE